MLFMSLFLVFFFQKMLFKMFFERLWKNSKKNNFVESLRRIKNLFEARRSFWKVDTSKKIIRMSVILVMKKRICREIIRTKWQK